MKCVTLYLPYTKYEMIFYHRLTPPRTHLSICAVLSSYPVWTLGSLFIVAHT